MRRRQRIRLLAAGVALLLGAAPALVAQRSSQDDAREIFGLTNQDRQEQGLPALRWNDALAAAAQGHADRMAEQRTLSHQLPGEPGLLARAAQAGAHFQSIAENIAVAGSPAAIERAWMHSTPHRTNILNPAMNALGVAVAERDGELYAVEDFSEASAALSVTQVEQRVRAMLRAEHVDASAPAGPAETACRMDRGMPPGTNARSMVRFQTPDLSQLPSQVAQQIRRGDFRKAAVGACSPQGEGDFTTYRVAILFY